MVQVRDDPIIRAMEAWGYFPAYSGAEQGDTLSVTAAPTAPPEGEPMGGETKPRKNNRGSRGSEVRKNGKLQKTVLDGGGCALSLL